MTTTREPTAAEARLATRFTDLVKSKRAAITRCLNTGQAAADAQRWIDSHGYGGILPRVWNDASDRPTFETIARRATVLEKYVTGLEARSVYFQPTTDGRDIDIVSPVAASQEEWPTYSLGILPLIIVGVVIVLVAAAIATAIGFYESAKKSEEETKRRLADLDLAAAKAGGSVASNWKQYKADNAKANGGILGALGENMGTIAIGGVLIALVIIFSKAFGGSRER